MVTDPPTTPVDTPHDVPLVNNFTTMILDNEYVEFLNKSLKNIPLQAVYKCSYKRELDSFNRQIKVKHFFRKSYDSLDPSWFDLSAPSKWTPPEKCVIGFNLNHFDINDYIKETRLGTITPLKKLMELTGNGRNYYM